MSPALAFEEQLSTAAAQLSSVDPVMGAHIAVVGPCTLERSARFKPFEALLTSITHQQLNGLAAQTILTRVKVRYGDGGWPTPERIVRARLLGLRSCGLSTAKAMAVKDLAVKTLDGTVPTAAALHRMDSEAIIERLTQVRGVGRWTVEMMLMFRLGRLDVLPVDDFGVRAGFTWLYRHPEMVTRKALASFGERWQPFRTVASWYLWRAADRARRGGEEAAG